VSHLLAVAALVLEDGGSEDEAIGALLHDVAEDGGGWERLSDVRARFGDPVAEIVAGCSDTFEDPKPPWPERKLAYLRRLRTEPEPVLRVSLADKLHNARAMLRDWDRDGEATFARFRADKESQRWYFVSLLELYESRLPGDGLVGEFRKAVERIANEWR
jgi:(p)ppGpp synthase/HD superfamily hydrolase